MGGGPGKAGSRLIAAHRHGRGKLAAARAAAAAVLACLLTSERRKGSQVGSLPADAFLCPARRGSGTAVAAGTPCLCARGELALIHAPVASPGEGGNAGVVDGDGGRAPTLPQARPSPSPGRRIPRRIDQRARPHLPHRGRHQISSTIARSPDARRPTICTVCTWRLALSRAERTLTPLRRVAEANARLQITITMTAPPSITRAVQL